LNSQCENNGSSEQSYTKI